MKLRFGIDAAARERIRQQLDGLCVEPPVGRRLSYVYLDTPERALEAHGVALRFRRSVALGIASPGRPWRRQEIWSSDADDCAPSVKKLGIKRLKQRLDATFSVRIERWSWTAEDGWATISLDRGEVSTGARQEGYDELRFVFKKRRVDAVMRFAVQLGAMHIASQRARDRGRALLAPASSSAEGASPD